MTMVFGLPLRSIRGWIWLAFCGGFTTYGGEKRGLGSKLLGCSGLVYWFRVRLWDHIDVSKIQQEQKLKLKSVAWNQHPAR